MGFTDKRVTCTDCSKEFIFSANEQEFYASKGLTNMPKRCADCRRARKSSGNGGGGRQGSYDQRGGGFLGGGGPRRY